MNLTKKIVACFLVLVMALGLIKQTIYAVEIENSPLQKEILQNEDLYDKKITADITNISNPTEVFQGDNTEIEFSFVINASLGTSFVIGEKIEIPTNVGDLFDAKWNEVNAQEIKDSEGNILATGLITKDKVIFEIKEDSNGNNELSGMINFATHFVAKDVGASKDKDVVKELVIGNAKKSVTFKYKNEDKPTVQPGSVDIDTFWKIGWSMNDYKGAGIGLEVNPIGSMDLYGSTSYNDRKPKIHDTFFVKDIIPENGFINPSSMKIYAAVPRLVKSTSDTKFNGWYDVPEGTYYAGRQGTQRYLINERMQRLYQQENETYEDFEARVKNISLSWGIYEDSDKIQTFICNFGRIGDPNNNNGIMYKDFGVDKWPEADQVNIWSETGASGGNVVSYYIEFDTYYPDVEWKKEVTNYASRTSYENNSSKPSSNGNSVTYIINNGGGIGTVRKNELTIQLLDETTKQPIEKADFKLQQSVDNQWIDTALNGTTDTNGKLTFGPLSDGKYKVVQTSTADGYLFDNTTYRDSDNDLVGKLSNTGEFTVSASDRFGYGAIVTNKKLDTYHVLYKFVSGNEGKGLPKEITDQLPEAGNVEHGKTAKPSIETFTNVKVTDGVWKFKGWTPAEYENVTEDVEFVGTWKFEKNASIINNIPAINANNKTLTVGDEFDPYKDVMATDKEDGDITKKIEILKNEVNTGKAGVYEVAYKVTDSKSASSVKTVKVTVIEKDTPAVPNEPTKPNDTGSVDTGDKTNMKLWTLLLTVSCIGAIGVYRKKRKTN